MRIVVLLSVGRHPATGRPRAALSDLSALALARALPGAETLGVHAGALCEAVHDYGAYGLGRLLLLPAGANEGMAARIASAVQEAQAACVIVGELGEQAASRGMLPYAVARALRWPLVPNVIALDRTGAELEVRARLDGATHRLHRVRGPAVLVARRGPTDHLVHAWARRAALRIEFAPGASVAQDQGLEHGHAPPHRIPAPPWALPDTKQCAARRLTLLRGEGVGQGAQVLVDPSPELALRRIADFLHRHGMDFPSHLSKDSEP